MSTELAKFDDLKAEVATLVAPTKAVKVIDFESSTLALGIAEQVKDFLKRVDDRRKQIGDPFRLTVDRINAYAKELSQPLKEAADHLQAQLSAFAAEQKRKEREEQRRIEEERIKKEQELLAKQAEEAAREAESIALFGSDEPEVEGEVIAPIEVRHQQEIAVLRGEAKTEAWQAKQRTIIGTKSKWTVRVVDINLVPEYLVTKSLNEKAALAMRKDGEEIPGLVFEEEFSVPIGGKTRVPRAALTGRDDGWKP